jgi:hypothetical protein
MAEFYPQERRSTCVVASLRSVLASQFGVRVREDVLRFAGNDARDPIISTGTSTTELRQMLVVANRALNVGPPWRLRVHRFGTIADLARELRAGRYPIVGVVQPDDLHHAVVVCGYRPGQVRYFDPANGRTRWSGSGAFRRWWIDDVGGVTWYAVVVGGNSSGA